MSHNINSPLNDPDKNFSIFSLGFEKVEIPSECPDIVYKKGFAKIFYTLAALTAL